MPMNKEITAKAGAAEIVELSGERLCEWDEVNLLTALHRIAKCGDRGHVLGDPRFAAMVQSVWSIHFDFKGYALANTSWAFAAMGEELPLLHALAASSLRTITDFGSQSIANLAWAMSRMQVIDRPLLDALAAQALRTLAGANPQNLSNTAWAFAKRGCLPRPLIDAISSAALPLI